MRCLAKVFGRCSVFALRAVVFLGLLQASACDHRLPTEPEQAIAAANTLEWLAHRYGMAEDPYIAQYLSQLTQRLASGIYGSALEPEASYAQIQSVSRYSWRVVIISADPPNAFSLGAGSIVLSRGMFLAAPSEDTLAAVIAHEMGHQILGHTKQILAKTLSSSGHASLTQPAAAFSLEQELAADSISIKLLELARFDPGAAVQAITVDYRQTPANVVLLNAKWLEMRMSNIARQLSVSKRSIGPINSAGQFSQAKKLLRVK